MQSWSDVISVSAGSILASSRGQPTEEIKPVSSYCISMPKLGDFLRLNGLKGGEQDEQKGYKMNV